MRKYAILLIFSLLTTFQAFAFGDVPMVQLRKMHHALFSICNFYVDSVAADTLVERAIEGMLKSLDPHSTYISADEVARMNEQIEGSFEGIGIEYQMWNDTLVVIKTIADGPAEKAGVQAGDYVISADGKPISGTKLTTTDIAKMLRGKAGSVVSVEIERIGRQKPLVFKIKRSKIPVFSVESAYMLTDKIGYIRIGSFSATTASEFDAASRILKKNGMKQLVLDLQDNGGGLLRAAVDLADNFLTDNQLVVYTEGVNMPRNVAKATARTPLRDVPLVVLVNEHSASASEVFAGALQDWDRATIVGRRTFGKGLVQKPVELEDGSLIRLTVSRYYTPSGRNIQKPYNNGNDDYQHELEKRLKHGELQSADSINFPDSLKYQTLRLGRTVYGGGGIMPDHFVPLDTTFYTPYYRQLSARGLIRKTVTEHINANRNSLKRKFGTIDEFEQIFEVDDALLQKLIANGTAANIAFSESEFEIGKSHISLIIKALIARQLFENGDYFRIVNRQNDLVKQAVEILSEE